MSSSDHIIGSEQDRLLDSLQKVDWKKDPDDGVRGSLEKNLNILQESIINGQSVIPIKDKPYSSIVVGDKKGIKFEPPSTNNDSPEIRVAIPLGNETVISSPGNPDLAVYIKLGESRLQGSCLRIFKIDPENPS